MSEASDNLKKLASKLLENYHEINNKADLMEKGPFVKSLIGKYFKYKNGYGPHDYWWVYKKVVGIKALELLVDSFEEDTHGKIEFDYNGRMYAHSFMGNNSHIPISKKEFDKAYKKILKKLIKRGKGI